MIEFHGEQRSVFFFRVGHGSLCLFYDILLELTDSLDKHKSIFVGKAFGSIFGLGIYYTKMIVIIRVTRTFRL
ncbi:hypothetical protein QVD17_34015 [Tagetes erecta]|uniref:Uncharacterized protein n=1 Tax=Tagetes erecta TaxID=13708 RepID=A0AAD8NKY6_TARER|nr:hypothetical protein QVD17_34015 [Tagetes erecta]